jgi:thiamine biosynthesis protein ThiS
MKVTINGQATELSSPATVIDVLTKLALPTNQVAVEINKRLVRRCDHQATTLNPGDVIEVVTLVGGG